MLAFRVVAHRHSAFSVLLLKRNAALEQVFSRVCKRLGKQAQRAAKKSPEFMEYLADLQQRSASIAEELQPVLSLCDRDNATECATQLVQELRTQLQEIYDTAKPDQFESTIHEAAIRFEEAG